MSSTQTTVAQKSRTHMVAMGMSEYWITSIILDAL